MLNLPILFQNRQRSTFVLFLAICLNSTATLEACPLSSESMFQFVSFRSSTLEACPFCGEAEPSLTERINAFDVVALAKFVGGEKSDPIREFLGTTDFEIIEVMKSGDTGIQPQDQVHLKRYRHTEAGMLVLLLGNIDDNEIKWKEFADLTSVSYQYLKEAPGQDLPTTQRLAYFLRFLEHADSVIAKDAFSEFAIAPYQDIVPLAPLMDRQLLRTWLENPRQPADRFVRLGLFGLLLGLCGTEDDAAFLKKSLLTDSDDYQFGIDGMTAGYLLIAGQQGFEELEREMLSDSNATQAQVFPLLQALRFFWTYEAERSSKPHLRQLMRAMLRYHGVADLVVIDLARWNDWDSMEQIVALYGVEEYDVPSIKRAILRYLLTAEKSASQAESGELPKHVVAARKHLEYFRKSDPKTVQAAQRYFFE